MTVLKDGTGKGYLVKVDDENFLHVSARTYVLMVHMSASEQLAFSSVGTTQIAAGAEKTILVLINNITSTKIISVKSIIQSIQGETGKPALIKGYVGKKTYTSGGTAITPTNLYAGSNNVMDVSVYQDNNPSNLVLGGTDVEFGRIYMEITGTTEFLFDGALILPPGGSVRIAATGHATAAGTNYATEIVQYFELDQDSIS